MIIKLQVPTFAKRSGAFRPHSASQFTGQPTGIELEQVGTAEEVDLVVETENDVLLVLRYCVSHDWTSTAMDEYLRVVTYQISSHAVAHRRTIRIRTVEAVLRV